MAPCSDWLSVCVSRRCNCDRQLSTHLVAVGMSDKTRFTQIENAQGRKLHTATAETNGR
jgi:hypothetical protein